jgi:phosphoglycerate dehydrogenase-like enzyme
LQIGILEPNDFSKKAIKLLKDIGDVSYFDGGDINIFLSNKNILFVRLNYYIGREFLQYCKVLRCICTPTTGLNHLDIDACYKKNIKVISLKGETEFLSTIRATPEHTFGLVMSLLRFYNNSFLTNNNREWNRDKYKGSEIYGRKIGIVGFGRVGRILAKYFQSFDAIVYYYDIDKNKQEMFGAIKLETMQKVIEKSEIIILSASYTDSESVIFTEYFIDLLKDKYFINTSRGELVNEEYLLKKISQNHFLGVALDVIQNEQVDNNLDRFLNLVSKYNLILTPHISGATYTSMHRTEDFISEKLISVYNL